MTSHDDRKKQEQDFRQFNKRQAMRERNRDGRDLGVDPNSYLLKHDLQTCPILIKLSKKSARFAVQYFNQRVGIIRPGIDCWIASASIRFGAFESKLATKKEAIRWLVKNFLKIDRLGLKFIVDCEHFHYTIENDSWLIKIDVFDEYCRSTVIEDGRWLEYRYFPDLNSAIACSFTTILNRGATIGIPSILEF